MTTTYTEPQVGIEPTTARLRIECSTPELLWRQLRNALARIRTATPCGTTPSRWRVYQFHHQGLRTATYLKRSILEDGADGARTRDLSSDSRVL